MVLKFMKMEINIQDNGNLIKNMVKVFLNLKMEINQMEFIKIINYIKEQLLIKMEILIRDILKIIYIMELEN